MKNMLSVVLILVMVSSGLMSTDIWVEPGDNTITAALATAGSGDRLVLVQEGVYSNDPLFVYKPVTIKAWDDLANKPVVSFLWSDDADVIAGQETTLFFTYASLTLEGLDMTMEGDPALTAGITTRMLRNRAYTGVNWKFNDCLFRDASQATMSITSVSDSLQLSDGSWHYDGTDYFDNDPVVIDGVTVAEDGEQGVLDTLIIDNCVFNNFMGGAGAKIKHTGNGSGVYSYTQFTNNTVWNMDDNAIQIFMRDVNGGDVNSLYGSAVFDHNTIQGVGGDGIFIKYIGPGSYITNTTISDVSEKAINCQAAENILVDYSNWYNVGTEPSNTWIDGGNNLQVDPLFTDASTGDLTLLEDSQLHGAGSGGSTIGDTRWYTLPDLPPVADAGDDIVMMSDEDGSATVTLNGSGSIDPNGDALTFSWALNGAVISTNVSFNYNLSVGDFTFTLTVSDGVLTDSDYIIVTVLEFGANAALSFTGANEDYVDCGNDAELQLGTHDLTVEFWFKTSASEVAQRIIANGGQTNSDDGYSIWILSNGKIRAGFSDGTTSDGKQTDTIVTDGNWHHCAVVFDRDGKLWVCVDGTCVTKLIDSLSDLNFDNTNDTFVLGRRSTSNSNNSYTGSLDEVRIWNTVLDTATVSAWKNQELTGSHPNINALQAYYKFNEGSGTTANDLTYEHSSSHESDGTITGAEWVASDISDFTQHDDCIGTYDECDVCNGGGIADGECDCAGNTLDCSDICGGTDISCLSINENLIPKYFSLNSYPNPFNPVTNIIYGLPEHVNVQIIIFDLSGKQVETLINEFQTPGYHSVNWNADNHPSGLYFVNITSGSYVKTRKLMLVK